MKIGGSKSEVKTILGSFISFSMMATVVIFGALKYSIMSNYGDTHIQKSEMEFYYSDDDILTDRLGFNIAFGLTSFESTEESIEDPDYGTTKAIYQAWGLDDQYIL